MTPERLANSTVPYLSRLSNTKKEINITRNNGAIRLQACPQLLKIGTSRNKIGGPKLYLKSPILNKYKEENNKYTSFTNFTITSCRFSRTASTGC